MEPLSGVILGRFDEGQCFHYVVLEAKFDPMEEQTDPLGEKSNTQWRNKVILGDKTGLITDEINLGENEIGRLENDINLGENEINQSENDINSGENEINPPENKVFPDEKELDQVSIDFERVANDFEVE